MSVYTPLQLEEVQQFTRAYGLNVVDLVPIQGGIQNTNYFIICEDQKQYVLTVFENETEQSAGELVPVLQQLAQHGVPVAAPLSHNGKAIHYIVGKPAQVAPRVWGQHPEQTNVAQVKEIATAQAKLHVALLDFPLTRSHSRGHEYWTNIGQMLQKEEMSAQDAVLFDQVYGVFSQYQAKYPNRVKGWVHSDLFRDNTLFEGDTLTGILDFFELNFDELLFDIAITINEFCTQYPEVSLDQVRVDAYLQAYQTVRTMSADELACLDVYLAMCACRFWLLRLNVARLNRLEGRGGSDVFQKDPAQMREMLLNRLARLQLESTHA
ncbi:homoserine kinase [Acinetobacter rathckeae]|uniref:homoserine kinase n=1 Tax=Acinetobacter rathckeae TaxID=2605272 RepID=UPI0018A2959C|nr:homoserine kinase [Acinetobacter rathckeae]MBF7688913.1 homoserine kinase [Acinetobacter rathckeae]MBF7696312.1 homoserine kinase [Acinetobacter rathckeae]